ncbi:hypothetical protein TNCV_4576531, partial [Trichonephila clavipes]
FRLEEARHGDKQQQHNNNKSSSGEVFNRTTVKKK